MEKKTIIKLIVAFIFICMVAFLFVLAQLVKKNSECANNPFVYSANQIIGEDGEVRYAICECSLGDKSFYFDKDGIYEENPLLEGGIFDTNGTQ